MKGAWVYVAGILGLTLIGVGAVVALEIGRPDGYNSAALTQIIAIVAPTIATFLVLLKSAANTDAIEEVKKKAEQAVQTAAATRQEVRINTNLTEQTLDEVKKGGGS